MKILHICLTSSYNTGWIYQENLLADQNVKDGHETMVVTTPYLLQKNSESYDNTNLSDYVEPNGVRVLRLSPSKFLGKRIQSKVRSYPQLASVLEKEKPDVIFFHNMCSWEVLTVSRYLKKHPSVLGFMDCHASPYNSATNFVSKYFLHSIFYRTLLSLAKKPFKKIFNVGIEGAEFIKDLYGISVENGDLVEFMPLGGTSLDDCTYSNIRKEIRKKLGLEDNQVAFLHTGKMNVGKGLLDTLETFDSLKLENAKLFLAGGFSVDTEKRANEIIGNNKNIKYLGWLEGEEFQSYMCAFDVLVQPKSQSVSFQQAICMRMAVILGNNANNAHLVSGNNGILVNNNNELANAIKKYTQNPQFLKEMRDNSLSFAKKNLYYSELAKRIYK